MKVNNISVLIYTKDTGLGLIYKSLLEERNYNIELYSDINQIINELTISLHTLIILVYSGTKDYTEIHNFLVKLHQISEMPNNRYYFSVLLLWDSPLRLEKLYPLIDANAQFLITKEDLLEITQQLLNNQK